MERRELTKADLDKVRDIEGFPIGTDEDIIALSDAPYYTACPNPFIGEFIAEHGHPYDPETDDYHREPFAADVSEGKNDPIYNAHSYHTKVPYKAIMRYILHYTDPGDIVLDGFCGTGMTGVAAQMCGCPDPETKYKLEHEMGDIQWGARHAILSDLSPAATFIAYNYNVPHDPVAFEREARRILEETEAELGWMYETNHTAEGPVKGLDGKPVKGRINYTVWSDVFICPNCGKEIVFFDTAFDPTKDSVKDIFECPSCHASMKKKDCEHAIVSNYDEILRDTVVSTKTVPVLINYSYGNKKYEKKVDDNDIAIIKRINMIANDSWFPKDRMIEGKESRRNDPDGLTHVHHFYTKRNLLYFSKLWEKSAGNSAVRILLQSINPTLCSRFVRYNLGHRGNGPLSGTLYISSLTAEADIRKSLLGKMNDFSKMTNLINSFSENFISTSSLSDLFVVPENSVDYIFTDPPFGSNLNYSELSFIWEAWLKVKTNNKTEAVVNSSQLKGLPEYQLLMEQCFREYYRVLKPGRWMTVEFHNSQNAVWGAIQQALSKAGFIIADVRTLDKQQGSFKQVNNSSAVKQDLVISAYKPKEALRQAMSEAAGTEETAWRFVRQHLEMVPMPPVKDGKIEVVSERQAFLLFDRMVAYHVQNGLPVPIDAADFYKGLEERFIQRDGMYFLSGQVNEYDLIRIKHDMEDAVQLGFIVSNEKTAVQWLYMQLAEPQTYQVLQPKFMQEVRAVDKYEKIPELAELLEENFLKNEKDQWYIPDVTKAGDIAKLREKRLLKEFEDYQKTKGKLKIFRIEAIRAGFKKLWDEKNYAAIVAVADRLPESVIQEDPNLLMYSDLASTRV
ncbi:MAG: hypothetical protein IJI57_13775 [Flexilinea sp.]|nr:hypothetical protein [Flexilinea sp.]